MSLPPPILIETKRLKTHPSNPRYIRKEKLEDLKKSITEDPDFMEHRALLVNPQMEVFAGNQRLRACKALGWEQVPCYVLDWDEDKQRRWMIKDNGHHGEWDWDMLANEWDATELEQWGLDVYTPEIDPDKLGEEFSLADGDKPPFQSMTFTLADEQAELIKNALADAKALEEFKYIETMGNDNSNGNALYFLVSQWAGQRI